MAPTAAPVWSLTPPSEFKPSGHEIIAQYLTPRALRGDTAAAPDLVADDVDVFSAATPAALPFPHSSGSRSGEVWGYFYGDYPIDGARPVPGGYWVRYGPEKEYVRGHGRAKEAIAFRRRLVFLTAMEGGDGRVVVGPSPFFMKEYRLNKGATAFRAASIRPGPKANMDCVVRKIFAKTPPPPPACSSVEQEIPASRYVDEDAGYSSDEDQKRYRCHVEEEPARRRGPLLLV
ncbi:uncharacterized protein [Lolium perenne]|uniref:uncharacterized protein n=1 Tax=Lolium perenne TaxID=4522 RepID=UPI0021EA5C29|nr:NAC domain-containing protein 23-like [Lolium perenne]